MGVGSILIDGGLVDAGRQEAEVDDGCAGVAVGDGADIPVVGVLVEACDGDISVRLGFEVARIGPVDGYVPDECESVREALIVLGEVADHLHRRRHGEVECQLTRQGGAGLTILALAIVVHPCLEESGGIVHRTALEARERQYAGMRRRIAAHRLELAASCRLLSQPVGICAAEARGTRCLMAVHHYPVVGGTLGDAEDVVDHPL